MELPVMEAERKQSEYSLVGSGCIDCIMPRFKTASFSPMLAKSRAFDVAAEAAIAIRT